MVSKQQRIVCFLVILIDVWLLVFPRVTISRVQQQDPASAQQQLLPQQTVVLSPQSEASDNNTPVTILDDSDLEVEEEAEGKESRPER